MTTQNLFILLIGSLFLFSCRKDNDISDPAENYVTPCSYFPAHPGTWWNYNSNVGQVTFEIDSTAHLVEESYLPYFKNLDCYINGCEFYHNAYYGLGQSGYKGAPIILEMYGNSGLQTLSTVSFANLFVNEFIAGGATSIQHRRELIISDTTVSNLNGLMFNKVLVMKEYDIYDSTHYYLEYFAENVGLVKRDSINISDTNNLIEILTLDQFWIND
ncbi:hypothetical protein K6119_10790 [Paracrocinitomix mangrovi]|uniref:hypothetical protein n=1 Tax=Paracrocinitomix mangrovi TaxID=2862509 RepID=UPI001C8F0A23|nr:hypothetical protein [Paracrocinitomix mangrovi]UKN00219.1 hypothetical protein K6119_10790 [Paracrocinitomix mangrovi]